LTAYAGIPREYRAGISIFWFWRGDGNKVAATRIGLRQPPHRLGLAVCDTCEIM
jgi:hypothetical protein